MNSKKQRRFRVWDNNTLYDVYQKVIQVSSIIESKCNPEVLPSDLPASLVPTDIMYDICACFEAMYDKLQEEELLQAGFPKQSKTSH
jgi:hypothetical protein